MFVFDSQETVSSIGNLQTCYANSKMENKTDEIAWVCLCEKGQMEAKAMLNKD